MSKKTFFAAALAVTFAIPAWAADIMVIDSYARSASPASKTGAAFIVLENMGDAADRLIDAKSDIAKKVELHTHIASDDGVMKMVHVEEGFELPAKGKIEMKRGGQHVMFMGLNDTLEQGEEIPITLVFEKAGEISVMVTVDLERKPAGGMNMMHGHMEHGDHNHGEMEKSN